MDNLDRVGLLINKLFAGYTHKHPTDQMIVVYLEELESIPAEELAVVVSQCLHECKFLPTIAELYERHRNLSGRLAQETAAEQWGQVQKAMREVGYLQTPRFRDPITAKIVNQWGWENLCASDTGMADRAHFLKMYQAISERHEAIDRLTPAARQLAERKGGLQPIGGLLPLPKTVTYEN